MTEMGKYMRDIYALEIAHSLLSSKLGRLQKRRDQMKNAPRPTLPQEPELKQVSLMLYVPYWIVVISGVVVICMALAAFAANVLLGFLAVMAGGWVALMLFGLAGTMHEKIEKDQEYNKNVTSKYKQDVESYEQRLVQWNAYQERIIPEMNQSINEMWDELSRIDSERRILYAENIIPSSYRTYYAVMFFYEWFGSCRSEDMDYAISRYEAAGSRLWLTQEINTKNQEAILNELMCESSEKLAFLSTLKHI